MGNWVIVSPKLFFNLNVLNLRRRRTHCCATINHSPYKLMEIFYQSFYTEYGRTCKDIGKAWLSRKHEAIVRSSSDCRKDWTDEIDFRLWMFKKKFKSCRWSQWLCFDCSRAWHSSWSNMLSKFPKHFETFWQSRDTRVTLNRPPMATGTSAHKWNCLLKIFLPFPGCLPREVCVMAYESCSFNQQENVSCGRYPTCKKNTDQQGTQQNSGNLSWSH